MPSNKTPRENTILLQDRVDSGDLDQYFNVLSRDDIMELSENLQYDNFDGIAAVLITNLSPNGGGLYEAINESYDKQMEDLAKRFLKKFISEQKVKAVQAADDGDVEALNEVLEDMDFTFPKGFRRDAQDVIAIVDDALDELRIPERIRDDTEKLTKGKKIEITDEMYARVKQWKDGRYVLEIRRIDNGRWVTYKIIEKDDYERLRTRKSEQIKIDLTDFREPVKSDAGTLSKAKTVKELRKDVRGRDLSFAEKKFIDARKEVDIDRMYDEYTEKLGLTRTKSEFAEQVEDRRRKGLDYGG